MSPGMAAYSSFYISSKLVARCFCGAGTLACSAETHLGVDAFAPAAKAQFLSRAVLSSNAGKDAATMRKYPGVKTVRGVGNSQPIGMRRDESQRCRQECPRHKSWSALVAGRSSSGELKFPAAASASAEVWNRSQAPSVSEGIHRTGIQAVLDRRSWRLSCAFTRVLQPRSRRTSVRRSGVHKLRCSPRHSNGLGRRFLAGIVRRS